MRVLIMIVVAILLVAGIALLRPSAPAKPTVHEQGGEVPEAKVSAPVSEPPVPKPVVSNDGPGELPGAVRPDEPDTQSPLVEQVIRPETGYGKEDVQACCKALRKLNPEKLTEKEREALRWYLFERRAHETVRNDTANVLLRAKDRRLAGALIGLLGDMRQTPVWRNYCVQHLAVGYRDFERRPEVIEAILRAATEDPHQDVRDVCLLHLSRIARDDEWRNARKAWHKRVVALAKAFLHEEKRSDLERISGAHAAGRLALTEEIPLLLEWLTKKDAPLGIRKASASALGKLGPAASEGDRKRIASALAEVAKDRNRLLRKRAQSALTALKAGNGERGSGVGQPDK